MKRFILFALLIATPAAAQSPQDIVTRNRVKYGALLQPAEAPILLRAIATDLTQTLGAPYGLLPKTSGNNCGGYACDIICNAAFHWDVFESGPDGSVNQPGPANPSWQPKGAVPVKCELVSVAAAPSDPGTPQNPPITSWLTEGKLRAIINDVLTDTIYPQNERIFQQVGPQLEKIVGQNTALSAQLKQHDEDPGFWKKFATSPYGIAILTAIPSILVTHQVMKQP